jgi:hypothetical protein
LNLFPFLPATLIIHLLSLSGLLVMLTEYICNNMAGLSSLQ